MPKNAKKARGINLFGAIKRDKSDTAKKDMREVEILYLKRHIAITIDDANKRLSFIFGTTDARRIIRVHSAAVIPPPASLFVFIITRPFNSFS